MNIFLYTILFIFIINCNQNYLWEKGHCCVRFKDEFPSQREGEGGETLFFLFKKCWIIEWKWICWIHNILQKHWTVCTYRKATKSQSITQINQMKSYCGEHQTSAVLPGTKSNDVLRLSSVNKSRIDCLQRLLLSPQAARRTVFTQFSPAGWIWQSVLAFT